MTNLTLSLDDELLRAARVKAAQQGTSVNEICRRAIAEFAGLDDDPAAFLARLQAVAARKSTPGPVGRRADWYDESGRLR